MPWNSESCSEIGLSLRAFLLKLGWFQASEQCVCVCVCVCVLCCVLGNTTEQVAARERQCVYVCVCVCVRVFLY